MANQFQQYGTLTDDGQRVIAYMESACREAEAKDDVEALNALSGPIKHYYVNVFKLKLLPAWHWLEDFGNAAQAILRNITEAEAAQQEAVADKAAVSALAESLEEVKAALALAMAKIAQLEAESEAAEDAAEMASETNGMESAPPVDEPAPETRRGKRG